jgi:uncharacterized membrane protein HdeD (DUF308 family)
MIAIASTVILLIGVLVACMGVFAIMFGKPEQDQLRSERILAGFHVILFPFFMILASLTLKYLCS